MQRSMRFASRVVNGLIYSLNASKVACHWAYLSTHTVIEAPSKTKQEEVYDVVIVGGGLVGAAVGCGLANSDLTSSLRVAIIDGKKMDIQTLQGNAPPDPRVSAITPATVKIFKDVGAWEQVMCSRHAPFNSMQVWDYTGLGYTSYKAEDFSEPALGYIVENKVLLSALHSRLKLSSFEMICPAQVENATFPGSNVVPPGSTVSSGSNRAKIQLDDGRCLETCLVIGADGGRSKVRNFAGIETTGWKYKQEAVICTVSVESEHCTAWQRFLPTGPLALLPLGGKFSNIVWSTTEERAETLKNLNSEEFVAAVNHALAEEYGPRPQSGPFQSFVDKLLRPVTSGSMPSMEESFIFPPKIIKLESDRLSFPLSLLHANSYVAQRLALVGDASHTVHPLAGQGVNLGFGDAASLASILSEAIRFGGDIGEVSVLKRYEKERMAANIPMMAILDGLQRAYSIDFGPLNFIRAAGFNAVQNFGPLKKLVTSYAMGKSAPL